MRGGRHAYVEAVEPSVTTVQQVLDAVGGAAALLAPVHDDSGRLCDLVVAAVSPEAVAPDGRHGLHLLGAPLSGTFPQSPAGDRWEIYARVLATGEPAVVPPFRFAGGVFSVRAVRLGEHLLLSWTRHDPAGPESDRVAGLERQLAEQRRDLAAEHEMAARLQQIVLPLPDAPIELPGLKVALRYLPAGRQSLVGGDWYHAAEQRDGSVLLAVGDVAGHGTPAATTMAQLRHALRALAVITTDPAALLGHLNRLTCELERETPELAATAVIARYDPARRRVTWAQAGHLPPLLSHRGRTALLPRPPGTVLGVVEDAAYHNATLDLSVGDVLLLYTDGLVEHRRASLDDGLAAVIATVDEAVAACPERPLDELLDRLRQANPDDDTCVLAARPVTGETQDLRRYIRAGGGMPPG